MYILINATAIAEILAVNKDPLHSPGIGLLYFKGSV